MGESKSRGELAEIRTTLAALASSGGHSKSETAVTAKRDVFKKIINYITIGIDMSSLFMQARPETFSFSSRVSNASPIASVYCAACPHHGSLGMHQPHYALGAAMPQVMTCAVSSGEDVVLKKMLYLYITTYAQHNPDLTLLTINLLTKDCKDQDPPSGASPCAPCASCALPTSSSTS